MRRPLMIARVSRSAQQPFAQSTNLAGGSDSAEFFQFVDRSTVFVIWNHQQLTVVRELSRLKGQLDHVMILNHEIMNSRCAQNTRRATTFRVLFDSTTKFSLIWHPLTMPSRRLHAVPGSFALVRLIL